MHNKQNFWLIFHFFLAFGERITLFAGTLSTTIAPAPIFALSPNGDIAYYNSTYSDKDIIKIQILLISLIIYY